MAQRRPTLIMLAGPNGSGKTTLAAELRNAAWFSDVIEINPDVISQERFGDWNSPAARSRAALVAATLASTALKSSSSLAVETVLTRSGVQLVKRARDAGYLIRFYFIATTDPAINIARVADRVDRGGHVIDSATIVRRYHEALDVLPDALVLAHHGHVYDNSTDGAAPRRLFRSRDGALAERHSDDIPDWAITALERLERAD